jgi:TRAP-type C4-dicarboxylate transport system permease small subunit
MEDAAPADAHDVVEPFGPLGRRLLAVCKVAAVAGAIVFVALVVMSIVSITGRKLWSAPVPGDVELLQLCSAFAAASFFAYCHLNRGDVKVDFFTERLPLRALHALDAIGSLLVGLFGALIAWRTGAGAWMVGAAGETSMILGLPSWLGQALMVPGFMLLALAGFYRFGWHLRLAARKGLP